MQEEHTGCLVNPPWLSSPPALPTPCTKYHHMVSPTLLLLHTGACPAHAYSRCSKMVLCETVRLVTFTEDLLHGKHLQNLKRHENGWETVLLWTEYLYLPTTNSYVEAQLQWDGIWKWGFWEGISFRHGHESRVPMISVLLGIGRDTKASSFLEHREKGPCKHPKRWWLPTSQEASEWNLTCRHLEFGHLAPRTVRNKFLLFKPPSYGILLWWPEETNTKFKRRQMFNLPKML